MYKTCIISCGMIANSAHIPAYRHFSDSFEIVGVSDISPEAARDTAARHGIPHWYTDAEEMLKTLRPDVVSVCVPNAFHKEMVLLALSYGCHVLCEKPLAFTVSDAREMYDRARETGRVLMACQSMRFTPERLAAKAWIDAGELGSVYYGELVRVRPRGIPTWGTFHMKKISGGGAFVDIGVHMLDALLWLMGNPKARSVRGVAMRNHVGELGTLKDSGALTGDVHNKRPFDPAEMDVEDFSCGQILFETGSCVSFRVAWAANDREASDILLIGKKAGISLPTGMIYQGTEQTRLEPFENLYPNEPFSGHFYLVKNLRDVLRGDAELIVKPEEVINTAEIIEAVYTSAETGREIRL